MRNTSSIPKSILDMLEEIKMGNINSSIVLTKRLVYVLLDFIKIVDNPTIDKIQELIIKMIETQPMMASIVNFCNKILIEIEKHQDSIKETIFDYSNEFLSNLDNQTQHISNYASSVIHSGMKIATYSYSTTVAEMLNYAKKQGKDFTVLCSESRPSNEGIILARYLGENGIKTILVTDAMLFSNIKDVEIIFVGADSLNKNGIINKVGTSALAKIAFYESIPFYHLCGIDKILPYDYPIIKETNRNPEEILKDDINNVIVKNKYFDTTPFDYITGIITEKGILSKEKLLSIIGSYKTHPYILKHILSNNNRDGKNC